MIIKKITLQNYKKFDHLDVEFVNGVNIIQGANEAGKSTIGEAILDVLFSDPSTQAKQFLNKIHPWKGTSESKIELTFEAGATYQLSKNFKSGTTILKNLSTGKISESYRTSLDLIEKITGIGSRKVYLSTAFIKQSDIASIERTDDFLSAIHKVALSTGLKINIQDVINRLEKEIKDLKVGLDRPAKNPGAIKLEQDRIQEFKQELNQKNAIWIKLTDSSKEQKAANSNLGEIIQQIANAEKLIQNNKILLDSNRKLNELDEKIIEIEEQLKSVKQLNSRLNEITVELKAYPNYNEEELDQIGRKLSAYQETIKLTDKELARLGDNQNANTNALSINKQSYSQAILGIGIIFLGLISSLKLGWMILLGSILIGVALITFSIKANRQKTANKSLISKDLLELESHIAELKKRSAVATQALNEVYSKYQVKGVDDFYSKRAGFVALCARKNEFQARLKGELRGRSTDQLEQSQMQLIRQKKEIAINELTEEVKMSRLSPESYLRKSRELDMLYLEKKRLEEATTTYRVRMEDSDVNSEDLVKLEEQIDQAQINLEFLKNKLRIRELTMEAIVRAMEETVKGVGQVVSQKIEQFLPILTNNKYKNARVTDQLGIEVFSDEKNDWIDPVDKLSTGAVDQVYFLTRIAFLQFLTVNKTLPLIFDDPFLTFDHLRTQQMQKIVKDLSKYYQIIILTHSANYNTWGESIKLNEQKM